VSVVALLNSQLDTEESEAFLKAIDLFNNKYFWECHEVLEDIWMTKAPPLKTFIQGIIQAAAAFYHVLNENPRGVMKLANDSLAKLRPFLPKYEEMEVTFLVERLQEFESKAQEIIQGKTTEFELSRIPLLAFPQNAQSGALV
jgi:predicted metal-dependent hydrolase